MAFTEAIQSGFANYTNFSARSTRSAYWWWSLFTFLVSLVAQLIDGWVRPGEMGYSSGFGLFVGLVTSIVGLALILPSLAVTVRRLHDTDRSGWWWLIVIIPLIGWLVLLYFLVIPGTPGPNRFGPPAGADSAAARYDLPPVSR